MLQSMKTFESLKYWVRWLWFLR